VTELAADGASPLWDGYTGGRDKELRRVWGLKLDWWEAIRAEGGGGCAVCHRRGVRLVVDDDHATGEIRGLLCDACNRKLDERMVAYLLDPPARRVGPFFVPAHRRAAMARRRAARNARRASERT